MSWARCSSGHQELGGALVPPSTRGRRSLTCMCPWYILPRRRQGSRGRGLPSGLVSREVRGGQRCAGSPRGARATGYGVQAGERAAGRAARCGAVLHAGAERARARGRRAGLSAGAVLLAAPLQLADPAPHSPRRSRGCRVPSRPRPRRQPAPATAAAAEHRARAALRAASPP